MIELDVIKMDVKGQASVEYLLLILVILVILGTVTIPMIGSSVNSSSDVSKASDAKAAVDTIANAADLVYANGPGSKRTLSVYIPKHNDFTTGTDGISMTVPLSGSKTKTIARDTDYKLSNQDLNSNAAGWHTVVVEWKQNEKVITVSVT
ncbi:class III signal peptide-containing protein [Methanobacterium aggregans]|uniref:class III signal peptide-containing protein n=1 Tax=Methanobacterium aggregans TaxID=1615586 RepID=UPI001FD9F2C6|nr:class III signal peptide-containing protein [Methanobacterium aggregans]MBP2045234.1 uncharacterized protein (UPF0333 family) [Methanobacterium aggregans]